MYNNMKIKRFNEYYNGPYAAAGFKIPGNEPINSFTFEVEMKSDPVNGERLRDILDKYKIEYDVISLQNDGDIQKLKLKFLSYHGFEAFSIIDSIIDDLEKKNIEFVPGTIRVDPKFVERKEVKGFRK